MPLGGYKFSSLHSGYTEVPNDATAQSMIKSMLQVEEDILLLLAECVALWGEPEQAAHGMKEDEQQQAVA